MAVDAKVVFHQDFPDAAKQAEALLEICQGDIGEAQDLAATNLQFAKCEADRVYWSRVGVLTSRQPVGVMDRLAINKVRRTAARKQLSKHFSR